MTPGPLEGRPASDYSESAKLSKRPRIGRKPLIGNALRPLNRVGPARRGTIPSFSGNARSAGGLNASPTHASTSSNGAMSRFARPPIFGGSDNAPQYTDCTWDGYDALCRCLDDRERASRGSCAIGRRSSGFARHPLGPTRSSQRSPRHRQRRSDNRDRRADRRDLRRDRANGKYGKARNDRRDLRHDRKSERADARDLRGDRRDRRSDRKDLNRDRRERRHDRSH